MKEFWKILREALPETIGGLIVAMISSLVSGLVTGQWYLAILIGCLGMVVIAALAYIIRRRVDQEDGKGELPRLGELAHRASEAGTASSASIGLLHRIPSGPFIMGSEFHIREAPPRHVSVAEFDIANVPVTVGQYTAFLDAGGANVRKWWSEAGWMWRQANTNGWGRANRSEPHDWVNQKYQPYDPVVGVTWFEAEAYCNWLGAQKNRLVRLPTEEEWEKAARGEDARTWPWGEDFNSARTNTYEHGAGETRMAGSPVGDKSPYGVADLGGNVQDWTSGVYEPLSGENFPATDLKIAKGGSWNDTAFGARASFRHVYPPAYFFPFLGFRIVVERL